MKPKKIRTTVDIPVLLYRRLKDQAAAQGCTARDSCQLTSRRVQFPLIRSKGPKVSLSSEQIYEHVEFP